MPENDLDSRARAPVVDNRYLGLLQVRGVEVTRSSVYVIGHCQMKSSYTNNCRIMALNRGENARIRGSVRVRFKQHAEFVNTVRDPQIPHSNMGSYL